MDKNAEKIGTEQWAIQKEIEEDQWQKEYMVKLPDYMQKINLLLANASDEAILEIINMFQPDHVFRKYKHTDEYATMFVIMSIYEIEKESGINHTILKQGRTTTELMDYLFQLKMILYRLDFEIGSGTKQELLSFLQQNKISPVTIVRMLETSVMRPLKTAMKLEKIFEAACLREHEISMLLFIEKNWKGNYRIYDKLKRYGKISSVPELEAVPEAEMGTVLELLELLWKFYYQELKSEREIAYYLKTYKITNKLWFLILRIGEVKEVAYYLLIANHLLEEGLVDKAGVVLEFLIEKFPEYDPAAYLLDKIREKCGRMGKSL